LHISILDKVFLVVAIKVLFKVKNDVVNVFNKPIHVRDLIHVMNVLANFQIMVQF